MALTLPLTALTALSSSYSSASAPDDEQTTSDIPVALVGEADVAIGSVYATLALDQEVLATLDQGVTVQESVVPQSLIEVDGRQFTIRLDPSELPEETVSDAGVTTISVTILSADGTQRSWTSSSVSVMTDENGEGYWADPLVAAGADPDPGDADSSGVESDSGVALPELQMSTIESADRAESSSTMDSLVAAATDPGDDYAADGDGDGYAEDDVVDLDDPVVVPVGSECIPGQNPWIERGRTRGVSTTIGTAYPIGRGTSWMTYNNGSSAEYTVTAGVAYKQGSGSFSQNATKTVSKGNGFDWDPKGYARSYRVQLKYQIVKLWYGECPDDGPPPAQYWDPIGYTGGFGENTNGVNRPSWHNCRTITSDGTWWRNTSGGNSYSYGAAVKFAGAIGIDLSAKRAYNAESRFAYKVWKNQRVCGNDDEPATSGKVMQRAPK